MTLCLIDVQKQEINISIQFTCLSIFQFFISTAMAQKESMQYEINMNSFQDQATHKQLLLEKLEFELSSRVKSKIFQKNKTTWQVKFCRKSIEEVERMFIDLRSYFSDLKLQFIYQLFAQAFKILILSYKTLSEGYIKAIQDKKREGLPFFDVGLPGEPKSTQKHRFNNSREIQYIDSMIRCIELDEKRLDDKKRMIEQNFSIQQDMIEGINASDAVNQLGILKRQLEKIVSHSEKIGSEGNMFASSEYQKNFKIIRKPDQLQEEFCDKIEANTKQKFVKTMQSITRRIYHNLKEKQILEIMQEINRKKPKMKEKQTQTIMDPKTKLQNNKDKGILISQNQQLRKVNGVLKKQITQLNEQVHKLQEEQKQLTKKCQITSEMLNKKSNQLQKAKIDFQYNLNKKQNTIESLNRRISEIKSDTTFLQWQNHTDPIALQVSNHEMMQKSSTDEAFVKTVTQQMVSSKFKTFMKQKSHFNSFFYEKQFKISKNENQHLRKSLIFMLDTLQDQKLIIQYPLKDFNNDLRQGKLSSKIQQISIELMGKVNEIKANSHDFKNQKDKNRKKTSILGGDDSLIQLKEKKMYISKINRATQTDNNRRFEPTFTKKEIIRPVDQERKTQNKLETLKKELMNKIANGKKTVPVGQRSRLFMHEIDEIKQLNNSLQAWKTHEENKQNKEEFKQKQRLKFITKDVSFQEFKFTPLQPKHYAEKKILHKNRQSKRSINKSFEALQVPIIDLKDSNSPTKHESPVSSEFVSKVINCTDEKQWDQGQSRKSAVVGMKKLVKKLITELKKQRTSSQIRGILLEEQIQKEPQKSTQLMKILQ